MPPSPESIAPWAEAVREHLPSLSQPQAYVLALWSYAAQVLQACGQSQVSYFLAEVLGQSPNTVRQRLREWTWERSAKAGRQRREVVLEPCFGALLAWVVALWAPAERRLALALDATYLGDRFVVLAVSVLYRGGAIPLAWQVRPANAPGAWRPHWLALLAHLRPGVPADWCVLVMADRGLFAPWLFTAIQALGWHPFLRLNPDGLCRPLGTRQFRRLGSLRRPAGEVWRGRVVCFKTAQLPATLLIYTDGRHADHWLILTDLAPRQADVAWYRWRAWIEAHFRALKRGGWQWQHTRMTDPARASRLWLVLAVTLLVTLSRASQAEERLPAHPARRRAPRRLSLLKQGWLRLLAQLIRSGPLPLTFHLKPDPWPSLSNTYP